MMPPIPLPPPDPALGSLPALLDGEIAAATIATHLPACAAGRVVIERAEPRYIRYKRGTSCLVGYQLILRHDGHDVTTDLPASARLYAAERGARRGSSEKLRRLLDAAERAHPFPPVERAVYVPHLRAMIQLYPVDYDLPALTVAASPAMLSAVPGAVLPPDAQAELIRYKPARKALLRYHADGAASSAVYGKLLSEDRGGAVCSLGHALRQHGVPTPTPLGYLPNERLLFHAAAPGIPLASLRGDTRYRDALEPTAEALIRLHATAEPALSAPAVGADTDAVRAAAAAVGVLLPSLAARVARLGADLAAALSRLPREAATIHGDFYDDQILVAPDGVTLIDLDEARIGHPLLDVGNFLAHLTAAGTDDEVRASFRDAYSRRRAASPLDVALFETIGLLKLAVRPFRHLDPDWPAGIERLVDLAEHRWRDTHPPRRRPSPRVETRLVPADPALPHLATLHDARIMADTLARDVYGAPVEVRDIALIRHKPRRRAILRYDLAIGMDDGPRQERLFGKTFASERGPSVFQTMAALAEARSRIPAVRFPEPIAYLPDLKLLLQRAVPGEPVTPALLAGDQCLAMRIAETIYQLHSSGVVLARRHDLGRELDPLRGRIERLGTRCPTLEAAAQRCLAVIERRRHGTWIWRWRPIHRDFYHDQILAGEHGLSMLDFDDAALAEPAIDVANFLAHLRLLGLQQTDAGDGPERAAAAFVRCYRRLDPDLDLALVRFLEGATLLRLAEIHQPRPDGDRIAAHLLVGSEHLMTAGGIR